MNPNDRVKLVADPHDLIGQLKQRKADDFRRREVKIIPEAALNQHVIALGKTGAGKSSALRSKGFIDYPNSKQVQASEALFPGGLN